MMPAMPKASCVVLFGLLTACASYPDSWVDPASTTGAHDPGDDDLTSYGGQRYRVQWRGDPAQPEQSLWRLRGDEPFEQVVPWGPWRSLRVTDDETFFVRERASDEWRRHRAGEAMVTMPGWGHVFTARADGFVGHYVLVDDDTALAHIDASGRELRRTPGDDFELVGGGLLVRRGDELLAFVDRDLQPLTTGELTPLDAVRLGRVWLVPTAAGVRVASAKRFVGEGPYADVRPLAFGEGRRVEVWAVKRRGDDAFRLAGAELDERTPATFTAVERAQWLSPPGHAGEQQRVVVARGGEGHEPWRVLSWDGERVAELARGGDVDNALQKAGGALLAQLRERQQRERDERAAAHERALAERRAAEQAERERVRLLAEERRQRALAEEQAQREFRAALVKGGLAEWQIDRYERAGTPLVVVGGKSYVGSRIVTVEDVVYDGSTDWENAPTCFLLWDGERWHSALKVNTGDGLERVLCLRDGRLQALPKAEINGRHIAPVAAAELLCECGRCGGDGVERRWREVLVYDRINGYRWETRLLRVGTAVRQGNFVPRVKFVPGTCNRCWGHGVVPHLPE